MLSIPLYVFLFLYFGFLLFFVGFILINILHLVHTGTFTFYSFVMMLFFLAFSAVIIWATWYFIGNINWQQPVFTWTFSNNQSLNVLGMGGL